MADARLQATRQAAAAAGRGEGGEGGGHPPESTHHFDECNPFLCVSYLRPVIRTCKAAGLGPTVTGSI